ncbi:MAG: Na(+)-translocating NADH-quinone reductase subunit A [Saprospiraceae bacterium]|nr:Na(+)-translocating NADH-quinone reductase subunit A [Saprospiraceae bacterium]
MLIAAFVLVGILLLLAAILSISDNLIHIEAQKEGIDTRINNVGVFPSIKEILGGKAPSFIKDGSYHKLKKGFDIKLAGTANEPVVPGNVNRYAVKPTNFRGIAPIPKVEVSVGDDVQAGDVLFYDKTNPEIKYVSPVSGEVVEVRRGAKRSISHVIVLADKEQRFKSLVAPSPDADRATLVEFLIESGIWPYIIQRPFDIVADTQTTPENIFISTFDTSPLAIDSKYILDGNEAHFQKGLDVLGQLTDGQVHLGIDGRHNANPPATFINAEGVAKHYFDGKHPAGNVGVQIHHVAPIKQSASVWTLNVAAVIAMGKLFNLNRYEHHQVIGLVGTPFNENKLIKCPVGPSIDEITAGNADVNDSALRFVNGNVLTGGHVYQDDFVNAHVNQLSCLTEGDYHEAFGWLLPLKPRPSVSKTFPAFIIPEHRYDADTNTHGERRAFVVTGQYEKVLPMNIYPQHLMKAIMAGDIERMEGLGINELSEEDLALCEFTCTSKMPLQKILREGLDMMREQA